MIFAPFSSNSYMFFLSVYLDCLQNFLCLDYAIRISCWITYYVQLVCVAQDVIFILWIET